MLEFIKWLSIANQYRQKTTLLSEQLFDSSNLVKLLLCSFEQWLSPAQEHQFVKTWLNQQKSYLNKPVLEPLRIAIGHHILTTDAPLLPPVFFEVFLPLIQQGNSLTFFYQDCHLSNDLPWLEELQKQLPVGALQLLPYQKDLWHFAINHPGVKNVLCYQAGPQKIDLSNQCYQSLFYKNHYFSSLGKASLIVLSEAAITPAIDQILKSLSFGSGFFPFNISRVIYTQKIESLFKEKLKAKLSEQPFIGTSKIASAFLNWQPKESEIIGEQGRILIENQAFRAIENVSNCSEFQLKPLYYPWVLLTDIKYPFESTKWINPASHHGIVFIWADENFKQNPPDWIHKLETTYVLINEDISKGIEVPWWQASKAGAQGELHFSWQPRS